MISATSDEPSDAPHGGRGRLDWAGMAAVFEGLSSPGRLAVFRSIVRAGDAGVDMRSLAPQLGTTGSAITVHVRCLVAAGLIHTRGARGGRLFADTDRLAAAVEAVRAERGFAQARQEGSQGDSGMRRACASNSEV